MRAYFQNKGITIYHGNCFDVLETLGRESIDLIIVDPPYGQNFQSGRREKRLDRIVGDDGTFSATDMLRSALRTLRNHRHVYCFGRVSFDGLPIGGSCELIWDKSIIGSGDLALPWGPAHEYVQFGVHEISKANRDRASGALSARLRRGSVLRVPRLNSTRVNAHPNEKPVDLIRLLIESSSVIGERVLDPCMGSGATLRACVLEGRNAIGIDIDEKHCESSARRIETLQAQVVQLSLELETTSE